MMGKVLIDLASRVEWIVIRLSDLSFSPIATMFRVI